MAIRPLMLKINEKPRKYHFSLSQSTFTLRNNSTGSTLPDASTRSGTEALRLSVPN
jgi:hypothetical protein